MAEGTIVITITNQTLPSSKGVYAYRAYTPTNIKTRASVPDATDMEVYGSYVGCNRINTTKVETALGISLHKIKELEIDGAINHWSAFGPTVRTISGGSPKMLVNNNPTRYRLADYAAYNHAATAPFFITDPHDTMISILPGETVHWEIAVDIGEAVYTGNDLVGREGDCTGIALSLWTDDGNLLFKTVSAVEHPMAEILDIETLTNEASFGEAPAYRLTGSDIHKISTPGVPYYGNVHYRIELVDLTPDVNEVTPAPSHYDWTGTHIICQIPGLESFPRMLREILALYIRHDAGPYPPTIIAEQFVTGSGGSAGHYSWEGATIAHSYANYLHVTAWVEDYLGNVLTDVTEIRAATPYVSGTDIYPFLNVHLWKSGGIDMALPVPAYDIVCVVKFDGN